MVSECAPPPAAAPRVRRAHGIISNEDQTSLSVPHGVRVPLYLRRCAWDRELVRIVSHVLFFCSSSLPRPP